ncbi:MULTISPECIES: response regulator transcription factor [unclassified Rhodanobacter]|jgi:two-component system, NarL family, response regulator FusR|uniref:response regulator n=1 Tax=unclassified Rhodanobacter TaxID=2621553 RepID=UPI001614322A|nr:MULTISPECIES: response regulator transcription factor [unclassified Rhodanobacter]MBB6243063.1 two-component system uhpT operon response regulator UhpA [Rhodanobacter sp. MP1X3]MBB6246552.1 two-component system uhpT operon response regulator UhpA [Rhodanobacter sp. A1T4]
MHKIVLVDDHAIVREGFKRLIELEPDLDVVAECRNGDDAVEAVSQWRPDLVALDLSLPDGSGLPLIEHLLSVCVETRIVVLSMHDGDPYVSEALRRGASGYVTKGVAPEELVAGLRAVMHGEVFLSSDLRERRAGRSSAGLDPISRLTAREREVFLLLAGGLTPKQVAAELGIGQKTVYIHRASLMGKLGAGSELDLYRMATDRGLLPVNT